MQVCKIIKLFDYDFKRRVVDLVMLAIETLFTTLEKIYKELSFLVKDIIDPDINYDSIEDMIE
ncbi:MAG: hypothetical protein DSZ05_08885 [Sulfurospirillum sp.]|nr:MAG: hypothetical protein DSZ05_08885 [Sulfurospirillum sp.]